MAARDATITTTMVEQQEPEKKHPPLPGSKEHHCTDVFWLFFFFLNVGCMGYIQYYAYQNGDSRYITRGYNSDKELCGVGHQLDNPFIYWCENPKTKEIIVTSPICVDHCPNGTEQRSDCDDEVFVGNHTAFDADVYPSLQIGHWCLPRKRKDMAHLMRQVTGNCPLAPIAEVFGDIHRTGAIILPVAAFISVFVGYLYLYLLDKCAALLCYICMLLLVASTGGTGGYLVYGALVADPTTYTPWLGTSGMDLGIGGVLFVVGAFCFFLFCFKSYGISQACGCIEAACECLMEEPTLLVEPFIALAIKGVILHLMAIGFTELATTGNFDFYGDSGIRREITWNNQQLAFIAFYIYFFLWVMEMTTAASQYVLAWTTQMWYYTPYVHGRKDMRMACGVLQGYCNLLRYHLGTIAVGALVIVYTRLLRALLGVVAQAAKAEGNPVASILATCCMCCITCFQRFIQSLTKNAYMDVAVSSSSFCTAAGQAFELLTGECPAVAALNGTQILFQVCGVGLITCSTVWSIMVSMSSFSMFNDFQSAYYVSNRVGTCVIVGAQAAFIGICFMHVFDTVGDTILYCFASEQRRHALTHPKANSDGEEHGGTWWGWFFGDDEDTSDEDMQPDYAPKKLKALVDQHNQSS